MGLKKKFKGDQIKTKLVTNYSMFSKRMIHFQKSIHFTILPAEKNTICKQVGTRFEKKRI